MTFRFGDVDVAGAFEALAALAEVGRLTPDDREADYAELLGAINADDQDLDPEYEAAVRRQAAAWGAEFGRRASAGTLDVLERLAGTG